MSDLEEQTSVRPAELGSGIRRLHSGRHVRLRITGAVFAAHTKFRT